eukprot:Hpha_TRINITY_DN16051_c1_g1::TRINITY_DN16051_c1_g1_i2::g.120314::m.120314
MPGADTYLTAFIALLKTNGGQDKVYKVLVNYCKLLVIYNLAEAKGSADKFQKALSDCRTVMRLGGWLDGAKKVQGVVKSKKMSLPIALELLAALTSAIYKFLDNTKFLHGKGVVSVDIKSVTARAKFYQFWQYIFGALAAWFGKDGYLQSVAAAKQFAADGKTADAKKAHGKATKALLKVTHHSLDTLGNLPGMDYIPGFKPPPSFQAGCGLASGSIVCYLQYNDQLDKASK